MRKKSVIFITLTLLVSALFLNSARADIEWSGVYRVEGNFLKNTELDERGKEKSYGLTHLVLRPKIVAGDGLAIYGQFNIMNNRAYRNTQLGQVFGSGINTNPTRVPAATADESNATAQNQRAETVQVSQVYLTYSQEYGQVLVGRAPLHFGLGATYNAGMGLFDHFYDSRDMVAYKFILGNMWIMPMWGKSVESNLGANDDINDYMIQFMYENPESGVEIGAFYQLRKGSNSSSDVPLGTATAPIIGGPNATNGGEVDTRTASIYVLRDHESWRLGLEASFQDGDTGVRNAGGENVAYGGFGVAAEFELRPPEWKWNFGLKAGLATGDDPTTNAEFEGFIFDRNYDVAMLMFNHPLGRFNATTGAGDFLRTRLVTGDVYGADGNIERPDVESISNVLYVAPNIRYKFSDRWSLDNTFITGWLNTTPVAGASMGNDLGYEWDLSLNYQPRKGLMWVNQAGFFFPGSAWTAGGQFDNAFSFGFLTKAAISF